MKPAPVVIERCWADERSARARLRIGRHAQTVRFEGVAPEPAWVPDAFAAAARVLAMESDRRVVSIPPVTPSFRRSIDVFQQVHLSLFPHHHRAPLHARHRRDAVAPSPDHRRVAAFFSAGVDSFDLVLEHGDAIDDLLFVRGFDVPAHEVERADEVEAMVAEAARSTGKPLLVVETDLRTFTDPYADWTWFVYGGLIATSLLLARTHRSVLCAASVADHHLPETAARLRSEPFGNAATTLRIEGRSSTRVQKLSAIAASGIAADSLRVCWQNRPGSLNCGECDKCRRTMAGLAASGSLEAVCSLPDELDLDALAHHPARSRSDRAYLAEARDVALAGGRDALADALGRALDAGSADRS